MSKVILSGFALFLLLTLAPGAASLLRADIAPAYYEPESPTPEAAAPEPIFFAEGQSEPGDEQQSAIKNNAEIIKQNPTVHYIIIGYTDIRGTEAENLALSLRMAEGVRNYLLGLGIEAGRLKVKAGGETEQFSQQHDEAGYRLNRRVVIQATEE